MILPATEPYPSREAQESALMRRRDPIIWGRVEARPSWLSDSVAESYEEQGIVILPGFFSSADMQGMDVEMNRLLSRFDGGTAENVVKEKDGGVIRSIFNLPSVSAVFERLTRHPKLLDFARYIVGSEVYLHQTRLNYKPAFHGKEFYWHSDFETWHVEDGMPAMRAVSCIILLTENHAFNGPLMVIPGSHKIYVACTGDTPADNYRYSLVEQTIGTPSREALSLLADQAGGLRSITGPAGTVAFFDSNLLHGSSGNITPYPRSNVFLVYNSIHNKLKAPMMGLNPRPEHIAHRQTTPTLEAEQEVA